LFLVLEFFSFNSYVLDFGLEGGVLGLGSCGLGLEVCVLGLALGVMSLLTSLNISHIFFKKYVKIRAKIGNFKLKW